MALTNQYIIDLRAGKINVATALLKPQTTQTYSANNTVNTKQFLAERGYDIAKPESIPNSVFYASSTKSAARVTAEERTLQLALDKQARNKAEQERLARLDKVNATMISTSNNSSQVPKIDYSDKSRYVVHGVSNNNVNPASLYTPQPVNVTGTSQNSSVRGGVNVDANYNYATAMNDFMTANPTSQVNMGESAQSWGYTAGLSSIPKDNDVESSILGGNGQHQETDVSTNATVYNSSIPQPKSVNYSQNLPALSSTAIILGGAAALLFLGKRK